MDVLLTIYQTDSEPSTSHIPEILRYEVISWQAALRYIDAQMNSDNIELFVITELGSCLLDQS